MSPLEYEDFYVGVYLPGRSDPLDICVQRTLTMFRLIKDIDPTFGQWFAKGWTRKEALRTRLDLNRDVLREEFEKHKGIAAQWWSLVAWNGLDEEMASALDVRCGSDGIDTILFYPHELGPTGERLIQLSVLTRLLRALVIAWEPQVGIVISRRHRDAAFENAEFEHRIGWINYFSHKLGAIPPLPSPVRTEFVEDKGSLVILTPERFSTSNPDHVALSLMVSAELKNAGLLRPLKQDSSVLKG